MSTNGNAKQKDWVLFPYKADDERALKIAFSGNVSLDNSNKGTILGVKGVSKDGNSKFVRVFAQVGVIIWDWQCIELVEINRCQSIVFSATQ
jgi:hypothetical protein